MTSPMISFAVMARTNAITRRTAIIGAAFAALVAPLPAQANELALEREQVELVAPPFVHPHEQATKEGPKIVEFRLTVKEKEVVIDGTVWGHDKGPSYEKHKFVIHLATIRKGAKDRD